MKPKTKFIRWVKQIPEESKKNIVLFPYNKTPMSLSVCQLEVQHETLIGDKILEVFGFKKEVKK